jgi:hypothetical protein
MKITLKVTQTDGATYQVTTNLFTIVAMERKFKIKASELASGIAIEHLAFLAFESCKQAGEIIVPVVFDDYIKLIEAIEVVNGETPNPTEAVPTPEA